MSGNSKRKLTYILFPVICLCVGGLSALCTAGNMKLFDGIEKPPLSPPAAVFPIVWTALYILMGLSAARIYDKREKNISAAKLSLEAFAVSLIFNFFWSIFFFNSGAFLFSFLWLVMLLALVVITVILYKRVDKTAAYLQIPCVLWLAFAGYLNLFIYILNK